MESEKTIVEYKITGRTGDVANPERFLTLGMRGRPQIEISKGGWFVITGSMQNDDVFESVKDLRVLRGSLRDAMIKCDCHLVKIRVSLTVEE